MSQWNTPPRPTPSPDHAEREQSSLIHRLRHIVAHEHDHHSAHGARRDTGETAGRSAKPPSSTSSASISRTISIPNACPAALGGSGVPLTYFFAPGGELVYFQPGVIDERTLALQIDELTRRGK